MAYDSNGGMLREWRKLSGFQQEALLAVLELDRVEDELCYGLAIKEKLSDWYGEEINHGRMYPNLDDLVEQGLLDKSEVDKRTNQYELTKEAQRIIEARSADLAKRTDESKWASVGGAA